VSTFLRSDWGAPTPAGGAVLTGPLDVIAIHHTAARTPAAEADVLAEVLRIYVEHTSPSTWDSSKPWVDIGYSWLVDAWGNIYEGRGWLRSGAHTPGFNSKGHAIAYIGWGIGPVPDEAIEGFARCVVAGQQAGAVTLNPTFIGHRDALATACPGDGLYSQIDAIRSVVLNLPPATIDPPEDDVLNDADRAWLQSQMNAITGNTSANAAYLAQFMQGLAGEHQRIFADLADVKQRLAGVEGGQIPTAAEIAAEIIRQMGAPK
jgi:peptidoglycan recognition protein